MLPTAFQEYIHISKYARWLPEDGRRETWDETVRRYIDFMAGHLAKTTGYIMKDSLAIELYNAIYNLEVMPSMRAMLTAGEALELENVAGYNCAYIAVDDVVAFDEAMYILMCGTGVGFSVESHHTDKLPVVPRLRNGGPAIVVEDSRAGWAKALRAVVRALYEGYTPVWDLSLIRKAGERLKTFGGRASGPEPLGRVFQQFVDAFRAAQGRKLTSLECHDLMCNVARAVIVGGVRRSAMISLSDLDDTKMRLAKHGAWWEENPDRAYANNSAVYSGTPPMADFMNEWESLYLSKSGERGMFNRQAVIDHVKSIGRDSNHDWGTNPCSEIILRPGQFCNLTEVVVRSEDNYAELERKVELATILGTFQSTLLHFPYLRQFWHDNCAEERLLGVSITGIMGNRLTNHVDDDVVNTLDSLKFTAGNVNAYWAKELGIPSSKAITCVKPSGTVSALCGVSSGIHPWHAPYYIRRVRQDRKDPLTALMIAEGVPHEDGAMGQDVVVFSFPMKAPEGAVCAADVTAVQQLEHWLMFQELYTEHKPSITVSVREHEWMEVGAWVYKHFDKMTGVSFLPYSDHVYLQAPFEAITKEQYEEMVRKFPHVNWDRLGEFEKTDMTTSQHDLACGSGSCEIF